MWNSFSLHLENLIKLSLWFSGGGGVIFLNPCLFSAKKQNNQFNLKFLMMRDYKSEGGTGLPAVRVNAETWHVRDYSVLLQLISNFLISSLSVRQLLQALPSRPLSNGYVQQKRLLSSPSSPKKEVLQSIKRSDERKWLNKRSFKESGESHKISPHFDKRSCVAVCPLRKSMSTERLTLVRREMAAESRSRTTSSSSSSGGKR